MSTGKTLLVEVGMEEAPSWFIEAAHASLPDAARSLLERERLSRGSLRVLSTPRRMTLVVEGLPERQPDETREVTGPPARIGLGPDGKFLAPALKFAEKQGAAPEDLTVIETDKGSYVAVRVHVKGRETADILGQVIPEIFSEKGLPHRKSMRWSVSTGPFVRPVHWLLMLLDRDIVDCELFGVKSDRITFGHRFHAPRKITIASPSDYEEALEAGRVVVDREKRRNMIRHELLARASAAAGTLVEDPELLEEVTDLVEWPVVIKGGFKETFLELPADVILTVMARHQRYFGVRDKKGALLPCFLAVANMDPGLAGDGDPAREAMIRGYERVLAARLEDGSFFFNEDKKTTLEEKSKSLAGMVFQRGAGDYLLKTGRVEKIAAHMAENILRLDAKTATACRRAASLCKADLASSMVFEFPELQGVMGGIYARLGGEQPDVCDGVAQHYLPASVSDPVPGSTAGAVVSLADKLDSLVTFMSLGHRPTSASDPLGFRRLCLGITRVILEKGYRLDLRELAGFAVRTAAPDLEAAQSGKDGKKKKKETGDPVEFFMEYLKDRLKVFWKDRARSDMIDSVLACGVEDLVRALKRLEALLEFQKDPSFDDLAVAFKRAYRIGRELGDEAVDVEPGLFELPEEKDLFSGIAGAEPAIREAYAKEDFRGVFASFSRLRSPIDRYFDKVYVNVEDEAVKKNRLAMMRKIADLVALAARLDLVQFERTKLEG
jgi:glycyl-tRNA synthetase beta chain